MKIIPITETVDYKNKSSNIQIEVNANKVNIDKSVFVKTPAEKKHLKKIKALCKNKY